MFIKSQFQPGIAHWIVPAAPWQLRLSGIGSVLGIRLTLGHPVPRAVSTEETKIASE